MCGKILEPQEVEELIFKAIENIQVRKKRANTISICKFLSTTHGLDESTTSLQLAMMQAERKIQDTRNGGSESFRVCVTGNSVNLKQNQKEKARQISDDEQRLGECRKELLISATKPRTTEEASRNQFDEEVSSSESDINSPSIIGKKETNQGYEDRFEKIENQLLNIFERLEKRDVENKNKNTDAENMRVRPTDVYEMITKINSLEKENMSLKDENFASQLKIAGLKQNTGKNPDKKLIKTEEI